MDSIILDTDVGVDDAVAIVTLLSYKKDAVKLIISSYGNVPVEKTTANTLKVLSLFNCDTPVLKGASEPLSGKFEDASHIHGGDGLGGLSKTLPNPKTKAIEGDFLQILYDKIKSLKQVAYITIGPLTNLYLLLNRFPDVKENITKVVTMGGGFKEHNVTKFAEFNIYSDPQSADYVLKNINDLTLVPLDLTNHVALTPKDIKKIRAHGTVLSDFMADVLDKNYENCIHFGEEGSTMHDATAVLCCLFPDLFTFLQTGVDVDCTENIGQTVLNSSRSNIKIADCDDKRMLIDKICECIR